MKKLTIEFARQCFLDGGCILLETEYINCDTKMEYRCSCENISYITFSSFQRGHRCVECGLKKMAEKRKPTFESVDKCFEENDCILLETEYKNCDTPMKYICNCGEESKITFYHFKNGQRCRICGIKKSSNKKKFSLKDAKKYFKDNGCKLLEKEYKTVTTPMRYRCSCGNISKISFSKFKNGQRCKKCGRIKMSIKMKGKNNYNYNHNLTDEEREIGRNYPEYREWRTSVYKRDDYTCQKCPQIGGRLVAHHIEGFSNNKDLRVDENNGITFCEDCHHEFHKIYGIKNVNRQQLEEFLRIVPKIN